MENNTFYKDKAEVIKNKYQHILDAYSFEDTSDDRRLAYNMYLQILDACNTMSQVENNPFVSCAVNNAIRAQMDEIDGIIVRFTSLRYIDYTWVKVPKYTINHSVHWLMDDKETTYWDYTTHDKEDAIRELNKLEAACEYSNTEYFIIVETGDGKAYRL